MKTKYVNLHLVNNCIYYSIRHKQCMNLVVYEKPEKVFWP